MASATNPPRPASRLLAVPRHVIRWVRGAPLPLKLVLAVLVVGTGAAGGVWAFNRRSASRAHQAVTASWGRFNEAARTGDQAHMSAALDAVLAADPADARAESRRAALARGEAAGNDLLMLRLTLKQTLRANDLPAAEREADKLLALQPAEWLAVCTKAAAALARDDKAAAATALDALPDLTSPDAHADPGGLAFAFHLYRRVGRDTAPLRAFVQQHITRWIKTPTAQAVPPADKLGLVECYLEGFDPAPDKVQPQRLVEAWAAVRNLTAAALDEAAGDPAILARVGRLGEKFGLVVDVFAKHGQITPDQAADFRKEDADRTVRAWQAVLDRDPARPDAYRGLALAAARAGDYAKARDQVARGLAAGGDDPDLMQLFSRMLQLEGRALEAFERLRATARTKPADPVWWVLAADAAAAANRRDLGLEAVQEFRAADPANKWAIRTEARLRLDAGDATAAAQLLVPLGTDGLAAEPAAGRLYVRALASAGMTPQVEAYLAAAEANAVARTTPVPITAALRGLLDAPPDAGRAKGAADRADRALERFPDAADLFRLKADALYKVAELSGWEAVAVAEAIRAGERFRAKEAGDRRTASQLVMLRLYGEKNADQAYRDAGPLRDAEADPLMSVAELEQLGMVYLRTNRPDDALRVLTRAGRSLMATAGCRTQLALALHASGRPADAKAELNRARGMPRTPREQADYVAAATLLYREKS